MKVILLQNVSGLGVVGDIKEVADGYAKNYLLPNQLANFANAKVINLSQNLKIKKVKDNQKDLMLSKKLSNRLRGMTLIINGKINESGRLYASINNSIISEKLKEKGIDLDAKKILLDSHIKELGEYQIKIKLDHGLFSNLRISVIE